MTKDLLIKYGHLLKEHFKSAKMVNYFLAVMQTDAEIEKMIKYIDDHPNATATDLDEYLIMIRW